MKAIEHIVAALESSPSIDQEHVRLARKALQAEKPAKAGAAPAPAKKSTAKKKTATPPATAPTAPAAPK